MGNLRPVLLMGMVFLAYLLWVEWQKDYGSPPMAPATTTSADVGAPGVPSDPTSQADDLPVPGQLIESGGADAHQAGVPTADTAEKARQAQVIRVTTDVLAAEIDLVGGTVVSAKLLNYPVELKQPEVKVSLLNRQGNELFIAQSGLLSRQSAPNHTSLYGSEKTDYTLADGADEVVVPLTWRSEDGVNVTKTLVFKRGSYEVDVSHELSNQSGQPWSGGRYEQLQKAVSPDTEGSSFTNPGSYSFRGIGFYSPEDKFEKVKFDDVTEDPFQKTTDHGWLAMIQHYFFAAWIPPGDEINTYSTQQLAGTGWPRYIARAVSPVRQVSPGASTEFTSRLYLGPKLQDELAEIAPGLEYTVNYGIFTVFSKPLFWLLEKIHNLVGNWGWAILLLTVLIKAAFFKLTEAQYKSMARMRKLQPRIDQLKERYGDDRQRMSQAMMEMYKKEKVNPLGGCLPILVQIPIFIALYWVLLESVELRQAPFILWIDNLSARDPYFILPLLNAGFMFATQRLTPMAGMDPLQRKMMTMMPLVFSVMFAFFPAGLVLYWATNAGLSLAQQYYITKKIAASDK
jgi:YidC/Oxa1 family membrane protein insertase